MPSLSNSSSSAKSKVVRDTDGNIVLEHREDPHPSVGMRYQEHQEKIDRVQIIINACIVHEAMQKRIKKYKQNRARKAHASKVSISRSVVQTMVMSDSMCCCLMEGNPAGNLASVSIAAMLADPPRSYFGLICTRAYTS
jgi:isocitrate/isopropylmalate dehydrogenase